MYRQVFVDEYSSYINRDYNFIAVEMEKKKVGFRCDFRSFIMEAGHMVLDLSVRG